QAMLEIDPKDTGAYNRIGVAYLQLGKPRLATQQFKQALELDKNNKIAKKQLERIKNKQSVTPAFVSQHFIEEPGKTKTVELTRLAGKSTLNKVIVGKNCELAIKNRYISVMIDDTYVGALPEDLSFRLTKLINSGNTYSCAIRSCCSKTCEVYLREETRSKANAHTHSFPPSKIALNSLNDSDADFDDELSLEENIPVEIVETDTDTERHIDELSTSDVVGN
ncbi:tetratricopeptide repeat protein, partial [Candidatus Woesebacteria bacterium]|nr:tetratricopeptide repeat protein [Candidatus Woesebacteria bacterium]